MDEPHRNRSPGRCTDLETEHEIVARYNAGEAIATITDDLGVSPGTIYRLLRIHGTHPNRKPHRRATN